MCGGWGNVLSGCFGVSNGVKQGGILSPCLFNVYVDDLIVKLNSCNTGCVYNGMIVNYIMHADDFVIFSPRVCGLSILLKECEEYGVLHYFQCNSEKSAIMIFKPTNANKLLVYTALHLREVN